MVKENAQMMESALVSQDQEKAQPTIMTKLLPVQSVQCQGIETSQ